eukprot:3639913-Pleurochrysis_carterae.AAC.1
MKRPIWAPMLGGKLRKAILTGFGSEGIRRCVRWPSSASLRSRCCWMRGIGSDATSSKCCRRCGRPRKRKLLRKRARLGLARRPRWRSVQQRAWRSQRRARPSSPSSAQSGLAAKATERACIDELPLAKH